MKDVSMADEMVGKME